MTPRGPASERKQTNVRLSPEARQILDRIAMVYHGGNITTVIEVAVKKYGLELGLWNPEQSMKKRKGGKNGA